MLVVSERVRSAEENAGRFMSALEALGGDRLAGRFNPYTMYCPRHDRVEAHGIRSEMLERILARAFSMSDVHLWVGREPGWRGARRTGLALTDDFHVGSYLRRWGVPEPEQLPTLTNLGEATATAVWRAIDTLPDDIPLFLWNVCPLHCHDPGDEMTNRPARGSEISDGFSLLLDLMRFLKPVRVVSVGADSWKQCERIKESYSHGMGVGDWCRVRHPSHGGARIFREQILDCYGIESAQGELNI